MSVATNVELTWDVDAIESLLGVLEAEFSWPKDYAAPVHNGAMLADGTMYPGCPWTTNALQDFNVSATFSALYQRYNNGDRAWRETMFLLGQKFIREIPVDTGALRSSQQLVFIS